MKGARWRWMPILMMVVVAGCLPRSTTEVPASIIASFGETATFTAQTPPAGTTEQDVADHLKATASTDSDLLFGRAVAIFGVIDCHGDPRCEPGPAGQGGHAARAVWVVLYPDCITADGTAGWVVVDADFGISAVTFGDPCRLPG